MSGSRSKIVAIFGPPGAGKTTAARVLARDTGRQYISSGDIARQVDPGAIARGEMANRALLRSAFEAALATAIREDSAGVVVDGLPRDPTDVALLPDDTLYVLLNARVDILIDRQFRRGRPGDDDFDTVLRRTQEQRALMELDQKDGWAYGLVREVGVLNTTRVPRDQMIAQVSGYVAGDRRTVS